LLTILRTGSSIVNGPESGRDDHPMLRVFFFHSELYACWSCLPNIVQELLGWGSVLFFLISVHSLDQLGYCRAIKILAGPRD